MSEMNMNAEKLDRAQRRAVAGTHGPNKTEFRNKCCIAECISMSQLGEASSHVSSCGTVSIITLRTSKLDQSLMKKRQPSTKIKDCRMNLSDSSYSLDTVR